MPVCGTGWKQVSSGYRRVAEDLTDVLLTSCPPTGTWAAQSFAFSPGHPIGPVSAGPLDALVLMGDFQRLRSRSAHDYLLLPVDFLRGALTVMGSAARLCCLQKE